VHRAVNGLNRVRMEAGRDELLERAGRHVGLDKNSLLMEAREANTASLSRTPCLGADARGLRSCVSLSRSAVVLANAMRPRERD
jgi:hypothetical protein